MWYSWCAALCLFCGVCVEVLCLCGVLLCCLLLAVSCLWCRWRCWVALCLCGACCSLCSFMPVAPLAVLCCLGVGGGVNCCLAGASVAVLGVLLHWRCCVGCSWLLWSRWCRLLGQCCGAWRLARRSFCGLCFCFWAACAGSRFLFFRLLLLLVISFAAACFPFISQCFCFLIPGLSSGLVVFIA
jgi:hypothetical protein